MEQFTDIQLFKQLKAGDNNALSELYLRHYTFLKHYGCRIVPDDVLVEECIQEMFVYIIEARYRLGDIQHVKAYLFSALRRRILEEIRAVRKLQESNDKIADRTNIEFSIQEIALFKETQRNEMPELQQALNSLPWRQREAIYLRYYNNLSTNDIAEVMGAANQTVLNTIYQALKKIRTLLAHKESPNSTVD